MSKETYVDPWDAGGGTVVCAIGKRYAAPTVYGFQMLMAVLYGDELASRSSSSLAFAASTMQREQRQGCLSGARGASLADIDKAWPSSNRFGRVRLHLSCLDIVSVLPSPF